MGKLHFGSSVKLTSESRTDTHGELCPSLGILTLGQIEKHVLGLLWLWNDGSQDRSGIQLVRFRVQRLGVSVSLAAKAAGMVESGLFGYPHVHVRRHPHPERHRARRRPSQ